MVYWSNSERLGRRGERCSYLLVSNHTGCTEDLPIIRRPSAGTAEKLFTPRLQTGFCGLHFPGDQKPIAFRFDVETIPYVRLWLCHGGLHAKHTQKTFYGCRGTLQHLFGFTGRCQRARSMPGAGCRRVPAVGLTDRTAQRNSKFQIEA